VVGADGIINKFGVLGKHDKTPFWYEKTGRTK